MNEKITFYSKMIYLNDNLITTDVINDTVLEKQVINLEINNVHHRFSIRYKNNYAFIYIEYGSALPRPDHVYNSLTEEQQDNPRQIDQIEPKQLFIILDLEQSMYWVSNAKKANVIIDYFGYFGKLCALKNIYDSKDFLDKMKSINNIKLSATPNQLFNVHSLSRNLTNDIFGYGASIATLQFGYTQDNILDLLKRKKFVALFEERSSFSSFIISGRDDMGIEYVFNSENVLKRIDIYVQETYNQVYDPEIVFNLFTEANL
jgi:hypothetical protein